jgi:hypothetical protein
LPPIGRRDPRPAGVIGVIVKRTTKAEREEIAIVESVVKTVQLGPEYLSFVEATNDVDPNSKDGRDILLLFDELEVLCPD